MVRSATVLPPVAIPALQVRQDRHLLDDDHRWAVAGTSCNPTLSPSLTV